MTTIQAILLAKRIAQDYLNLMGETITHWTLAMKLQCGGQVSHNASLHVASIVTNTHPEYLYANRGHY